MRNKNGSPVNITQKMAQTDLINSPIENFDWPKLILVKM